MKKTSAREPGITRVKLGTRFGVSLILLTAILGVPAPASSAAGTTTRVSVASDGTQANSESGPAEISADGRYVAFESTASNLVPGDTNNSSDVFVHDRNTGSMERVSVAGDGTQANGTIGSSWPAISADGRYVAFQSFAPNLVPGDTNGQDDVFVHDRVTGSTERVSVASDGTQGDDKSFFPAISGDGRYVAFQSLAPNLVPGDTNNDTDVFVHDRVTGSTEPVGVASDGTLANRESVGAAISPDGRYVSFTSPADNLVPGDTNDADDVFVHDRVTGSTGRVSVANDGTQANDPSGTAAISADGRYVAFTSFADNLVPGDTSFTWDAFLHDRVTGSTVLISAANDTSGPTAISADGRYVAFQSLTWDVLVHDRVTGSTEPISVATDGTQANDSSGPAAISGDGRYVAFPSTASNLVPGDTNGNSDVFVRDRQGAPAGGGGTSETVTLTATADSYVSSGATGTNFGTSAMLGVDNSPVEATYLKFNLSAYVGRTLESATLQLRSAGSGSTGRQNVKLVANNTWTESGAGAITYANRPALGTSIGTLGPTTTNTNYSIPLTVSGLTGELGQQLSLGLDSSSSDGLDLNSKETGSTTAPKLVLRLGPSGGTPSDTTAPVVSGMSPASGAAGVAVTANVTGSFSEALDASTVTAITFTLTTGTTPVSASVTYNSTDKVATLNPGADLAAGTTYTARIRSGSTGVKDLAGNPLATDKTWTFTTAAAGGGVTSETVTLTATADSYVSSGAAGTNFGTSAMLGVDNSPVEATYLKFNLSAYAGRTLESATLQLRSAGSGSTGRQNVKLVANDTWTESGAGAITYANRPALGTSIGTLGPTTTNTNYSIPLTVSGLAGELGQQLSLGLDSSSSDGLDLNSKEAGSTAAPKLVLTLKK
ncbi:DNRLRE domain-containing protein [Arthrobacter sp. NPDC093125]|uniref:CBM96 family carbohydrate-binding protein n=1 Tax=Arthrobacter sp. NPDC093125 TaxID=3363944 RepID=UPI0038199A6D